jgi:hypothetical protein
MASFVRRAAIARARSSGSGLISQTIFSITVSLLLRLLSLLLPLLLAMSVLP